MWGAIFNLALLILNRVFGKIDSNESQRKAYLDFLEAMASRADSAAKLHEDFKNQVDELKKQDGNVH